MLARLHILDGAIGDKHKATVSQMACDLVRLEATATERDALRALMGTGKYRNYDVAVFTEDAMLEARLAIVAANMVKR